MTKFRFSLDTVLKVRRQAEELRQRELAAAQVQRELSLQRVARIERDMRELLQEQSTHRQGSVDLNAERWFQARHLGLSLASFIAKDNLKRQELALDEARARAVEASRERRVLEKLEENQLAAHLLKLNREEQGFLDDLAQRAVSSFGLPSISATGLTGGASH